MAEETTKNSSEEKVQSPTPEITMTSARDFLTAISDNRTSNDELLRLLAALKGFFKTQPNGSAKEFGQNGLNKLSCILEQLYYKTDLDVNRGEKLHLECIHCLKELLNKTEGLQLIIANKGVIRELCKSLDYTFPSIMIAALESLSVICFLNDGHKYILQGLTEVYEDQKDLQRFSLIIDGLAITNDVLACSCWKFMNAVINSSNDLDLRLHLRNEFMRVGLRDILKDTETGVIKYHSKEIEMQLNLFHRYREQDCEKIFKRFDNLRFQFGEIEDCFQLIKTRILDTECEPLLLSILQHLLYIRDDPKIRVAYYRLIEECISQIVIHHSGCDPDFRTSRKVTIYVHPEIGHLPQKDDGNEKNTAEGIYQKIEEIVLTKQALEDKISEMENELQKYRANGVKPSDGTQISKKVQFPDCISTIIPILNPPQTMTSCQPIKVENGKLSIAMPKSPDKVLARPSFLHSMRIRSKSLSGNNVHQKEMEEKARKAKEADEKAEKGRKKREEKKQALQKIDRVARQSKVDRSMARRSLPPVDELEAIQVSDGSNTNTSKDSGSTIKIGPLIPVKAVNEETEKSKPRWH